jgi:NADPH:quinone reductase-like Zn-dependent oxidoreductase
VRNRRVMFTAPGQVAVTESESPRPGAGQILVETRASLISVGTELAHLTGPSWTNPNGVTLPRYPSPAGYSNVGVVIDVGAGVSAWTVGDRVASNAKHCSHPS